MLKIDQPAQARTAARTSVQLKPLRIGEGTEKMKNCYVSSAGAVY
jgi:hypothetical protein